MFSESDWVSTYLDVNLLLITLMILLVLYFLEISAKRLLDFNTAENLNVLYYFLFHTFSYTGTLLILLFNCLCY
jgi:hypothetical protein